MAFIYAVLKKQNVFSYFLYKNAFVLMSDMNIANTHTVDNKTIAIFN